MPTLTYRAANGLAVFSGRRGGVSTGRFAEANVSSRVGDDPAAVRQNRRKLLADVGLAGRPLVTVRQQHGAAVVDVRSAEGAGGSAGPGPRTVPADGMITRDPTVALMVGVADCVPVILLGVDDEVAGVLHTGRRGLLAGIVRRGVAGMRGGERRIAVRAVVGPAIGSCCYALDAASRQQFLAVFPDAGGEAADGHPSVDLRAAVHAALVDEGVDQVVHLGGCTAHAADSYFSSRRDGATGCQAGIVALRPAGC